MGSVHTTRQYDPSVLDALREVCQRHFGRWDPIDGNSVVAINQQMMGFDAGVGFRVRFDDGREVGGAVVPDILVSEDDLFLLDAENRWPSARGMNLATFVEFLTSRFYLADRTQQPIDASLAALDRFPSARFGAVHRPVVDCCISGLTAGQNSQNSKDVFSRPMLILGRAGSGKSGVLKKVAFRATSALGFHSVQIDAHSRREGVDKDFLISAALGSRIQIPESFLLELARYMHDRILVLIDNIHQDVFAYTNAARFASQNGLRVVAAARLDGLNMPLNDLAGVWDCIEIEPLWPNEVSRFIVDLVSPASLRNYYPTLSLVKSIVNIEVAGDLHGALTKTHGDFQTGQPLDEKTLAVDLFAGWLDRASGEQADAAQARTSLVAITGLHAIETLIRRMPDLPREEAEFLDVASVLRLTDSPKAASFEAGRDLISCPFLAISEGDIAWTSELMHRAAVAHFLVGQLAGEGTIEPDWPPEINLPHRALFSLVGPKFLHPLMGAIPLHDEILIKMAHLIKDFDDAHLKRVTDNLHRIVDQSRASAFYSVWPWRFAGGNSLALLARLARLKGKSLTGDFSRCRLPGANLAGFDLSQASFRGSLLSKASLRDSRISIASVTGAFLGGATVDADLARNVRTDDEIPVFGLREAEMWDMLRVPGAQLCVPDPARLVEPFAISPPITNGQFQKFAKADNRYSRDGYLSLANHFSRDVDDYYLKHWLESDSSQTREEEPVTYVGRDAAIAYLDWAGGRLPTPSEWMPAPEAPGLSEWLWSSDEFPGKNSDENPKTAIDWREMHYWPRRVPQFTAPRSEGWLAPVGIPDPDGRRWGRIRSINANEDVTFRAVFDFVQLMGGQL